MTMTIINGGAVGRAGDALLESAFAPNLSPPERVDLVGQTADRLADLIATTFIEKGNRGPGYRASMILAVEPSLEAFAGEEGHTTATAETVAENIRSLSEFVIERAQLQNNPGRLRLGIASEIAIIGLGWWGIASKRAAGDSYLLPATTDEDASTSAAARDGVDVFIHLGGDDQITQPVQSKTKRRSQARPDSGVISVSPKMLISPRPGDKLTTLRLLKYLASDDEPELALAFDNLLEKIAVREEVAA